MTGRNSASDPEREIALLSDLPYAGLVACWLSRLGTRPPKGLSRKLLLLALAYRIQADAFGDLDSRTDRCLRAVVSGDREALPPRVPSTPVLKPGMRLMREWNGRTHVVDVTETGLLWNEQTYTSLSAIACAITGALVRTALLRLARKTIVMPDRQVSTKGARVRKKRCAIYTRKSTDEGLEQDFNSLDAQREACEAYILSQAGEGWLGLPHRYDDGGFSGGSMNRPGLTALLADIAAGKVDVVVVYKVDRLTRALSDFARLVDVFDTNHVSFVSVTQAFNTTTSMGRLTLNVLLSFAQFEREVTAERIRDKIAASKKKGMWMGGLPPLGYDNLGKKLIINAAEAETVRRLFALYLEHKNVRLVKREADRLGLTTKPRKPNNGRPSGNLPFTRGHLYKLLANPLYAGLIAHKGQRHEAQHTAIITRDSWEQVQACLAENGVKRRSATNSISRHTFASRIFDETGDMLRPHHANKKGRRYHYYVSRRLLAEPGNPDPSGWRLPARELNHTIARIVIGWLHDHREPEACLLSTTARIAERTSLTAAAQAIVEEWKQGGSDPKSIADLVERIELAPAEIRITLDRHRLSDALNLSDIPSGEAKQIVIAVPVTLKRRGIEARLVTGEGHARIAAPNAKLVAAVAAARNWFAEIQTGEAESVLELAARHKVDPSHISRTLPLAFLAPDIVNAIIDGRIDPELTLSRIRRLKLPVRWQAQRELLRIQ
ncbi:MAG: recombinase family protein [Alphaproteobacteria bacterium]